MVEGERNEDVVRVEKIRVECAPRLMKTAVAEVYLGGRVILMKLEELGLLAPARATGKSKFYDRKDLDAAVDAARVQGWMAEGEGA